MRFLPVPFLEEFTAEIAETAEKNRDKNEDQ
jgi:hypothetical protein